MEFIFCPGVLPQGLQTAAPLSEDIIQNGTGNLEKKAVVT